MSFIGLAPRAKYNRDAPLPEKGVLIREPAICADCGGKCKISVYYGVTEDGYYTYYNDKLCKICAKKQGIV
jgi:hypothetical protein